MEIPLTELGYFTERDCKRLKSILDHQSYMDFTLGYSNYAGNCNLVLKSDYDAPEDEIVEMFVYVALFELARAA